MEKYSKILKGTETETWKNMEIEIGKCVQNTKNWEPLGTSGSPFAFWGYNPDYNLGYICVIFELGPSQGLARG